MAQPPFPDRRTSPHIPGASTRPGMARLRSIGCLLNTSPSDSKAVIGTQTSLIGRAEEGLLRQESTSRLWPRTDRWAPLQVTFAPTEPSTRFLIFRRRESASNITTQEQR